MSAGVNILMYHSISDGAGPTCISPAAFRAQMQILDDCGYAVISLEDFAAWHRGERELPQRSAVITFDDGYLDFATHAFPELQQRGWTATVFLPTNKVGGRDDWPGGSRQPLMGWNDVSRLASAGIRFGAHTANHVDLTAVPPATAIDEIDRSQETLADRLGRPATAFAPPYGRIHARLRHELSRRFQMSAGTVLDRARRTCDRYDAPRIEMHYFRNPQRWRSFLNGGAALHLALRQTLRRVRYSSLLRSP
jgi:peptidoglycan/xylan/chitin deacetylase (PgdA/CDA1 family)